MGSPGVQVGHQRADGRAVVGHLGDHVRAAHLVAALDQVPARLDPELASPGPASRASASPQAMVMLAERCPPCREDAPRAAPCC